MIRILHFNLLKSGDLDNRINFVISQLEVREQKTARVITMSIVEDSMWLLLRLENYE